MDPIRQFEKERAQRIKSYATDRRLQEAGSKFIEASLDALYSYNFSWLGRPIIQYPQDLLALQEIAWRIQPDLVIELGIAHGGSLIFQASLLELLGGAGRVLGVDIDIRAHNRQQIEQHPLAHRISMIEGSSIDPAVAEQVHAVAQGAGSVLLCIDSMHTHQHVLRELEIYTPLVSPGSYAVVFDGIIERMPASFSADRPWGPGDNPLTATRAFLNEHPEFEVDEEIEAKLQITAAPSGYLRRRH
ncbi:MAG: cephalosporin hydroxylase [Rickettsiales bacterium]|nr:cephalosporin hydroxylase [Rickettsiales bacterium]|tara:strand:+ start:600 stop:1334 length:735 start_codon:yes stop_codon:yes gene_type:complete